MDKEQFLNILRSLNSYLDELRDVLTTVERDHPKQLSYLTQFHKSVKVNNRYKICYSVPALGDCGSCGDGDVPPVDIVISCEGATDKVAINIAPDTYTFSTKVNGNSVFNEALNPVDQLLQYFNENNINCDIGYSEDGSIFFINYSLENIRIELNVPNLPNQGFIAEFTNDYYKHNPTLSLSDKQSVGHYLKAQFCLSPQSSLPPPIPISCDGATDNILVGYITDVGFISVYVDDVQVPSLSSYMFRLDGIAKELLNYGIQVTPFDGDRNPILVADEPDRFYNVVFAKFKNLSDTNKRIRIEPIDAGSVSQNLTTENESFNFDPSTDSTSFCLSPKIPDAPESSCANGTLTAAVDVGGWTSFTPKMDLRINGRLFANINKQLNQLFTDPSEYVDYLWKELGVTVRHRGAITFSLDYWSEERNDVRVEFIPLDSQTAALLTPLPEHEHYPNPTVQVTYGDEYPIGKAVTFCLKAAPFEEYNVVVQTDTDAFKFNLKNNIIPEGFAQHLRNLYGSKIHTIRISYTIERIENDSLSLLTGVNVGFTPRKKAPTSKLNYIGDTAFMHSSQRSLAPNGTLPNGITEIPVTCMQMFGHYPPSLTHIRSLDDMVLRPPYSGAGFWCFWGSQVVRFIYPPNRSFSINGGYIRVLPEMVSAYRADGYWGQLTPDRINSVEGFANNPYTST